MVTSLGSDHVIDDTCDDFADGSRTYDLVGDIAGDPSLRQLRRALEPRETGRIAPSLDRTRTLDEVPQGMRQLESGQVRGKVAITPGR
jgi:NADPH:quinone reductase-like Zn-dependent oxidoreductase